MSRKKPVEFFAILETAKRDSHQIIRERTPTYINMDEKIAKDLATVFTSMAETFFKDNPTVVDFDGRYTPSKGEMFVIKDFRLDAALLKAVKSPLTTPELSLSRSPFPQIKAIIASEINSPLRIIFQEFRTDQIIRQGRAFIQKLLHGKNTFDIVDQSGIAISGDVDAVYDNGNLYFHSYYTANRFADLTEYFKDATDDEIKDLLKTDGLMAADENQLLEVTDTAMRRKFSIIKKTEILNLVTPERIQAAAVAQDIDVEISRVGGRKRIVIPSDKADAKVLLDFLCQARFFGALTNELFVANSYRPVVKKAASGSQADLARSTKKKGAKKKAARRQ
jgi:hypothetical protein